MTKKSKKSEKELEKDWEDALKKDTSKKSKKNKSIDLELGKEAEGVAKGKINKSNKSLGVDNKGKDKNNLAKEEGKNDSRKELKEGSEKKIDKKINIRVNKKKGNISEEKTKADSNKKSENNFIKKEGNDKTDKKLDEKNKKRDKRSKKIKKGDIKKNICKNVTECLSFSQENSWIFTILFFVIILIASIWIWQKCILNPLPDNEVIIRFEQSREEKEAKSEKIKKVIEKLQERKKKFLNPPNLENQREIFENKNELDYLNTPNKNNSNATSIQ